MKTLLNSTSSLLLGIAMLASSPITACAHETSAPVDLTAASAELDNQVAKELTAQLRAAREVPHPVRVRRPPSVEVTDVSEEAASEMSVVVVEASRLPPLDTVTAQAPVRTASVRL
jgi:hypothetical protein